MPVKTGLGVAEWKQTFRRVLINGAPLSGKTTSLRTWPAIRHIVVAPGELGFSSVIPSEETKVYYWEFDPATTVVQYKRIWAELQVLIQEIVGGKYGPVTTLALDGLHKIYYVIQKAHGFTPTTDGKAYTEYHEKFTELMVNVLGSNIPYVVATCYDGQEPIELGSSVTQIFPDLPGKMAKGVLGMFPVVLHSERTDESNKQRFVWRLRPQGKIKAVGLHLPPEISEKFPAEMAQDWREVEKIVDTIGKEVS